MKERVSGNRKKQVTKINMEVWGRQVFNHGTDHVVETSMIFYSDRWRRILKIFGDNCFN